MLLTSSQVSMVLSTAIVAIFTFLLFISGYVLQQRSIEAIRTEIRPKPPIPLHRPPAQAITKQDPSNPHTSSRRLFPHLKDRVSLQSMLSSQDEPFDWSKLAYAQLVRDHEEVCNALIFFDNLNRMKSPVPRLLLFPRKWAEDREDGYKDVLLGASRRLLKKASKRYRVILVPIDPVRGNSTATDNPEQYSLASLFSLAQYERVLSFPPPGLILNSSPLDSILAFSESPSTISAYPPLNNTKSVLSSLIMVKPSTSTYKTLKQIHASSEVPDIDLLTNFFPSTSPLLTFASSSEYDDDDTKLYTTTQGLRTASQFNVTAFTGDTAFVLFQDGKLPGPEYDFPYTDMVKMRPKNEDQGFIWQKMYTMYKDKRYGVCGLDLEVWPPPGMEEGNKQEKKAEL